MPALQFDRYIRNEEGTTAIEYAFVASLVSIAAVGAMMQLGLNVNELMDQAVTAFL